ncbi:MULTISPECIES: arsenate reductase family protein [Empedobacter]|uniref:Arsenate reductase family protein n=2 Tax=Empedobacter TaxID=59734 RepID=A0A427BMY9_9FLAO|nr:MULTISPECIES: arsenate reductase family protein [Empedobacter]MDH0658082.1 arsenate reductase family protein [Empedobacter sp. GD03865]MDH0673670.1 arsenate reductase family protein [Empedobacter sp. GD03861]MDH1601823.1 arsenate reductase family protein [Empedobacter sp. GD03739]RRT90933.1 arsenate reductase family protein [Empedobacter falsenii]RRT91036.1 arsenate reductase family protein [Empedobacter falsenii]
MYTILHNSRCGKSRDAVKVLEESGKDFEIREYLKEPLTKDELRTILTRLNLKPIDIVRTNEEDWKINFKGKELSDDEVLNALVEYPKLIQRPIVTDEKSGVVGRPKELVENFIK